MTKHAEGKAMAQELERNDDPTVDAVGEIRADYLPGEELAQAVERGDITETEANRTIQAAQRRHVAVDGPDLDTDEDGQITTGGFGAGQGMASQSTGGRNAGNS